MGSKVVALLTPGQSEKDIKGKNAPKPPKLPDYESIASQAEAAARERLKRRRGRAGTILTGGAGVSEEASILNKKLLG